MSHIDVTPPSRLSDARTELQPAEKLTPEAPPDGNFARGLVLGLALGLTFWLLVVIELVRH